MNDVLDLIAKNRNEDNQVLLKVISDLEQILHPNHYLILGMKEIVIQRLMKSIANSKRKESLGIKRNSWCDIDILHIISFTFTDSSTLADYKLRTDLFSHVAMVMQMVDSKGSGWLARLEMIRQEEADFTNNKMTFSKVFDYTP